MTGKKEDGGPAFPRTVQRWNDTLETAAHGMTLRDYFAAACIKSTITPYDGNINEYQAQAHARFAYMVADAMLKEREK